MFNISSSDLGWSNREEECDHHAKIPLPLIYFVFADNAYQLHSTPLHSTPLLSLLLMIIGYSSIPSRPCTSICLRLFVTNSNARDSFSQDTMLYHVIATCHALLHYSTRIFHSINDLFFRCVKSTVWCGVVCFLSSHFINFFFIFFINLS